MAENKKMTEKEVANSKAEKLMNTIARKASYFRANPQRLISEYFGISLRLFQKILIFCMMKNNYLIYCASRGQGELKITWQTIRRK